MFMTSPNQWDAVFGIITSAAVLLCGRHTGKGLKGIVDVTAASLHENITDQCGNTKMGGGVVDETMQRLPLVVGGEQGWHSGRAPLTLGSAQRCSVCLTATSGRFSPSQSLTTLNLNRCCCPQTCSLCLLLHPHRLPPSSHKQK